MSVSAAATMPPVQDSAVASFSRASRQVHRTVFVQAEPTAEWRRLFDVAREAYDAVARGMTPGSTEGDVIRNASVIGDAGFAIYDDLIHGYGTGQLKRALAGLLRQHPLVARFDAAPPEQGGGGVTVVELKE